MKHRSKSNFTNQSKRSDNLQNSFSKFEQVNMSPLRIRNFSEVNQNVGGFKRAINLPQIKRMSSNYDNTMYQRAGT